MPSPGSDRFLAILALTLLGAGCVLVLWPFLTALVWAGILASTSWPAFLWLDRAVGGRRTLAASLMTLLVTVVLLGPIVAVALALADPITIELPRAIELIDLKKAASKTRELGEYEGGMLEVGRGRFGPFVRQGKVYANIPKGEDPEAVTLERGIELIKAKLEGARAMVLKEFEGSEIQVLAGRYGPYITDGSKNANVPKEKEPGEVTLEEAIKLLAEAPERKGKKKAAPKKKAAAKKAAPKKKAAKKKAAKKKP